MRKREEAPDSAYVRKVFYSREDRCWVAVAPEISGCAAHGETDAAALRELDIAIRGHLAVRRKMGYAIPKPVAHQENAGRFLLRLPKTLQKHLREEAAEEGVSINQYAVYLIAMARGQRHPILA